MSSSTEEETAVVETEPLLCLKNGNTDDGKEIPIEQTELEKDKLSGYQMIETVYSWSAIYNSDVHLTDRAYHPYDDGYDEAYADDFIQDYLMDQGIEKEKPDGVSYNQKGDPFVEYYIDEALNKYCFVVHLWADYWIDYEAGTSKYRDAVYCTTYYLNEADKGGYVFRNFDGDSGITRERVYDPFGKKAAEISYEYQKGIPFPFVTDGWNLDMEFEPISLLCRNQVFWFYKEFAQFNESGRFIGYHNNTNQTYRNEYLPYQSSCFYDKNGRFTAISEKLQQEDIEDDWGWWDKSIDYSGQIKVTYSKNDKVKALDYFRSSYTHGTTDSSGSVEYDEKGRMIYNEYYITHGSHINIYLYEENSEMPWVCFNWCSYAPGFENIYLFRKEP